MLTCLIFIDFHLLTFKLFQYIKKADRNFFLLSDLNLAVREFMSIHNGKIRFYIYDFVSLKPMVIYMKTPI